MKIAYFGKKRPKVEEIPVGTDPVTGEVRTEKFTFDPFKETEVPDEVGRTLLINAPDIYKRTDKDERKLVAPHQPKTDGYVGDAHASQVPDIERVKKQEAKEEEGKDIDQVIKEAQNEEKSKHRKIFTPNSAPEINPPVVRHGTRKRILANEG